MTQQAFDEFEQIKQNLFNENQAKLPVEDRMGIPMCDANHDNWRCTKKEGHTGEHISHGILGYIHFRWTE